MNSQEFQQLVAFIRKALTYSAIGLSTQELQALSQRLDSDAFKAAVAVDEFFELKRQEVA